MTLTQFLEREKSKNFHMEDAYFKQILSETGATPQLVLESCILDHYLPIIREFRRKYRLNSYQVQNYKYNPKKLSYEAYGSIEYWFLIMHANELFSASQFSLEKGYMYMYVDGIQQVVNEIMNVERKYIQKNAAEVSNFITSASS